LFLDPVIFVEEPAVDSKNYFDTIASQWDEMRRTLFSENVREMAYAVAGVQAGDLTADIGAGTGFVTEGLLERGARVIAVDQSAEMLRELERKFGSTGRVECRAGTAEALPLQEGEVQFVFANMYLHHVECPAAAIREMARILQPDGELIITDMDAHTYEFLRIEQHDRWLGFARSDVQRWFEAAGLEEVVVKEVGET
jgi:ubiquinone/menaquinone biosynthesis C-methylase UbiE